MKRLFIFSIVSFSSFLMYLNPPDGWHSGCEAFTIKNNQLLINMNIEGQPADLLLDFGGTQSSIANIAGQKTNSEKQPFPVTSNLFNGQKNFISTNQTNPADTIGVFGYNIFQQNKMGCHFDFDTMQFCNVDEKAIDNFVAETGYKLIKTNFKNKSFSIFITIRRKEYEFIFDTTYSGIFKMPHQENIPFLKDKHTSNALGQIYNNRWITFNEVNYASAIIVTGQTQFSQVGIGFIKGFNWIVDIKHRKVYVKKNSQSLDTIEAADILVEK